MAEAQSAAKIAAAKRKLDSAIEDANANLESQQQKFAIDDLQGQDTDALYAQRSRKCPHGD